MQHSIFPEEHEIVYVKGTFVYVDGIDENRNTQEGFPVKKIGERNTQKGFATRETGVLTVERDKASGVQSLT